MRCRGKGCEFQDGQRRDVTVEEVIEVLHQVDGDIDNHECHQPEQKGQDELLEDVSVDLSGHGYVR